MQMSDIGTFIFSASALVGWIPSQFTPIPTVLAK